MPVALDPSRGAAIKSGNGFSPKFGQDVAFRQQSTGYGSCESVGPGQESAFRMTKKRFASRKIDFPDEKNAFPGLKTQFLDKEISFFDRKTDFLSRKAFLYLAKGVSCMEKRISWDRNGVS